MHKILIFNVGSFGQDAILVTEGSILDACCESDSNIANNYSTLPPLDYRVARGPQPSYLRHWFGRSKTALVPARMAFDRQL